MLNRIRIIKLFKKLLSIIYREKEKNILLAKIQRINSLQKIKKSKGLINLKKINSRALNP